MQQHSNMAGASLGAFLSGLVVQHLDSVFTESEPVKLAADPYIESLIVACCEPVKALAWRFARSSSDGRIDQEEMYSIGLLEICECVAAGRLAHVEAAGRVGYLVGVARLAMCQEWRRAYAYSTASLDRPLSDDTSLTLADFLPAPASSAPAPATKQERALHGALDRLTPRRRAAIRRRYALEGHGPHSRKETGRDLGVKPQSVTQLARRGVDSLRADARLCEVVGVEVQQ